MASLINVLVNTIKGIFARRKDREPQQQFASPYDQQGGLHPHPSDISHPVSPRKPTADSLKADQGKDPWHLIPTDALRAVVKVLAFGQGKYQPRGWEQGMAWSRVYSALLRHLTAWWEGCRYDEETGYSHLWHAATCVLFLVAYELRGIGTDDRPKRP